MNSILPILKLAPTLIAVVQIIQELVDLVSDKLKMQKEGQDTSKEDENIDKKAKRLAKISLGFLPDPVKLKATPPEVDTFIERLQPAAFAVVRVIEAVVPLLS